MVKFLKENGYPIDVFIDTEEVNDDGNKKFRTRVYLDESKKNLLKEFYHEHLRDRIHFANGIFSILRYKEV